MNNLLSKIFFVALAISALAVAGCSDNTVTTNPNPYFQLKSGDTFSYVRYDRDSTTNATNPNTKTIIKWTVLATGMTKGIKTNATQVLEVNYDSTGVVEKMRDTLYFSSSADGKVYQYDLIGSMLSGVPVVAPYLAQITPQWVLIADTKAASGQTWDALELSPITLNVTVPIINRAGILKLTMTGAATGTKPITTASGLSFPNSVHSDLTLGIKLSDSLVPAQAYVNDSIKIGYDFDINGGVVQRSADNKTLSLAGTPLLLPGFLMQLSAYHRTTVQ